MSIAGRAAVPLSLILAGCFSGSDRYSEGGTATETTNHIAGTAWSEDGRPVAHVRIALVEAGFNPLRDSLPADHIDTTDERGRFVFTGPDTGSYHLEGGDLSLGTRFFRDSVHYVDGGLEVSGIILRQSGALRLSLPDTVEPGSGFVYIPGTTIISAVGRSRFLFLDSLPAARLPAVVYARDKSGPGILLARDVEIRPADTAELSADPALRYRGDFRLNTTPTGGDVAEDVHGFPLLVRLDSSNFDFSQTFAGGAQIGFAKPDGTPIAFEIERWEGLRRKAEIWIRMDTVEGKADTQWVVMHWGRTGLGLPDGSGVFDSAGGFAGVWHLQEDGTGKWPDASPNGHGGKGLHVEGDESVEGNIAGAAGLDSADDLIDVGIVNVERTITVSAWVRPDGLNRDWNRIVNKPFALDTIPWKSYALQFDTAGNRAFFEVSEGTGYYGDYIGLVPRGRWSLLHGVYDGATISMYLDGKSMSSVTGFSGSLHQNRLSTLIGAYSIDARNKFFGAVDEVRIEKVPRSPAWVKLCYENQRSGSTLVQRIR